MTGVSFKAPGKAVGKKIARACRRKDAWPNDRNFVQDSGRRFHLALKVLFGPRMIHGELVFPFFLIIVLKVVS